MPLTIRTKSVTIKMSDFWMTKEEFDGMTKKEIIELFKEDAHAFLDELGGINGILDNATIKWKD